MPQLTPRSTHLTYQRREQERNKDENTSHLRASRLRLPSRLRSAVHSSLLLADSSSTPDPSTRPQPPAARNLSRQPATPRRRGRRSREPPHRRVRDEFCLSALSVVSPLSSLNACSAATRAFAPARATCHASQPLPCPVCVSVAHLDDLLQSPQLPLQPSENTYLGSSGPNVMRRCAVPRAAPELERRSPPPQVPRGAVTSSRG